MEQQTNTGHRAQSELEQKSDSQQGNHQQNEANQPEECNCLVECTCGYADALFQNLHDYNNNTAVITEDVISNITKCRSDLKCLNLLFQIDANQAGTTNFSSASCPSSANLTTVLLNEVVNSENEVILRAS